MHYKFWSKLSKPDGKCYLEISVKVIFITRFHRAFCSFLFTAIIFICLGIKKYIVSLIIKISSDPVSLEREKMYLNKLNMILVQVKRLSSVNRDRESYYNCDSSNSYKFG